MKWWFGKEKTQEFEPEVEKKQEMEQEDKDMFQMREIGKRIAKLRKDKNMTQMELADHMGVSFQAVSNWERGESMPDIAKLVDLSNALGVTVDELLGNDQVAKTAEKLAKGEEVHMTQDILEELAPIMKPSQVAYEIKKVIERDGFEDFSEEKEIEVADSSQQDRRGQEEKKEEKTEPEKEEKKEKEGSDQIEEEREEKEQKKEEREQKRAEEKEEWEQELARKKEEWEQEMMRKKEERAKQREQEKEERAQKKEKEIEGKMSVKHLIALAPFMDEEELNEIVKALLTSGYDGNAFVGLAPFLSAEVVGEIAIHCAREGQVKRLNGLAPFMQKNQLDECVEILLEDPDFNNWHRLIGLAPFLGKETLDRIIELCKKKGDFETILSLVPFAGKVHLKNMAWKIINEFQNED